NNAYCQDTEISWIDWDLSDDQLALLGLVRWLVRFRREHPVFRQRAFFLGRAVREGDVKDLAWFTAEGVEMADADWWLPACHTIGMYLSGEGIRTRGPRGEQIVDDSFFLVLHATDAPAEFRLPGAPWGKSYDLLLDTAVD